MATHSSVLAWRTPWTEEPGGLQSIGSRRVRRDGSHRARIAVFQLQSNMDMGYSLAGFCCIHLTV